MMRMRARAVCLFAFLAAGTVGYGQAPGVQPAKNAVMVTEQEAAAPAKDQGTANLVQEHPATAAQLHEYYELTHALVNAHTAMRQMVSGMQATSAPYLGKAFWDDMRDSMDKIDLEAAFLPAYQKYFSEEDMQKAIDFYRTPAGQRMLSAQPLIVSAASDVLRKQGAEIGKAVYARHKDEIEAAKKAAEAK